MDTVFRRLFAKKSNKKRSSSSLHLHERLQGQPYDTVIDAKPPTKGTYPLGGNGPAPVIRPRSQQRRPPSRQDSARPSIELVAKAPSVPRRRFSDASRSRPQTAPQGNLGTSRHESHGDPWSRYAAIIAAPPTLRRKNYRQSTSDLWAARHVRTTVSTSEVQPSEERLPYVDLLEAFWRLKPSQETYLGRAQASGRRDYGEDVADRNIAEYVPSAGPHLAVERSVSGQARFSRLHGDETGDDTTWDAVSTAQQLGQIGTISTYAPIHDSSQRMVHTYANTAGGPDRDQERFKANGLPQRTRPYSAFADSRPAGVASSRPTSMTSVRSYLRSSGSHSARPLPSSEQVTPARSKSVLSSKGNGALAADLAPISTVRGGSNEHEPMDPGQYSPTSPASSSRLPGRGSPLTPSISPTTNSSPIERRSLDHELPPTQGSRNPDASTTEHTDQASEYAHSRVDSVAAAIIEQEDNGLARHPSLKKRPGRVFDESADDVETKRAISPIDSTDAEVILHQKPAVVHENVTQEVHEIREEQITREIHYHDVLHRIQPIIDVEILPAKHYMPSPSGNDLIEIPAPTVSRQHQDWKFNPVETSARSSSETAAPVDVPRSKVNSTKIHDAQPAIPTEIKMIPAEGILREETIWRHRPELETGGQRMGQTVPIDIYHDDSDDDYDEYADRRSSLGRDGEELLFNDSEAFGGRLPGLDDCNPTIPGAFPSEPVSPTPRRIEIVESEATKALKRRQAEVTRKLSALSVKE